MSKKENKQVTVSPPSDDNNSNVEPSERMKKIKEYIEKVKASMPTPEQRIEVYKAYQKEFQKTLYYFTEGNPFIGNLLQEFNFRACEDLPTAALAYDKKQQQFSVLINPWFFMFNLKSLEERMAVLHHEILHFTNKHLFRFEMCSSDANKEDHKRANYATDLSINQYISGLPDWCLHVRHFKLSNDQPFPIFQTAEIYYDLLKDNPDAMKQAGENCKQEMKGKGQDPGEGNTPGGIDEHDWEQLSEDEKKQMANEMKSMLKRTIEKTNYSKSSIPQEIQDLMQEIDAFIQSLDCKSILARAIKKHASSSDRTGTWNKPNKRYGVVAPGSINAKMPKLLFGNDTSGSVSVTELNQYLRVMDQFLSVGERKCEVALWHTRMYHKQKYRKGQTFTKEVFQSGGTDLDDMIVHINKVQPDLTIILTDGYYSASVELKGEVIFIITEGGAMAHPLANKHKTIPLKGLKGQ